MFIFDRGYKYIGINIRTTAVPEILALCLLSCNGKSTAEVLIDEVIDTIPDQIYAISNCKTDGGTTHATGLKVWCSDITLSD